MPFLGPITLLLAAASVVLSLLAGTPAKPPAIALDSMALLNVERAASTFAILLLALVVIHRAFEGRLPDELSGRGVKYTPLDESAALRAELAASVRDVSTELDRVRRQLDQERSKG